MITAPARLSPWLPQLESLPADLALGIYPLIARLASALGPLPSVRASSLGEPEGYAGFARRGTYTRLLPTEWLLASELPDEFMRRAVNAEHMFFELARQQHSGTPRAIVLFDSGPSQLGGPRLLHLAALIAFARRAQAAFAQLCWGVLQAPECALTCEISSDALERLLERRSAHEPTQEHARRWHERIGPLQRDDDAWLVGGPELVRLTALWAWPRLRLEQSLDPAQRCVEALLEHRKRPPRCLTLALPPEADCVQLLRDPYRRAQPAPRRSKLALDPQRPLWFAPDGRRVFAWLRDGAVVSFPVPNSARATPGKARVFRVPHGETVLAAGSLGRRIFALSRDAAGVYLHGAEVGGRRQVRMRVELEADVLLELDPASWVAGVMFEVGHRLHVLSAGGQLLAQESGKARLLAAGHVLCAAALPRGRAVRVRIRDGLGEHALRRFLMFEVDGAQLERHFQDEVTNAQLATSAAYVGYLSDELRCVLTLTSPGEAQVFSVPGGKGPLKLHVPPGAELHGVIGVTGIACMLLLESDRRTPALLGVGRSRVFPRAHTTIAQLCVSQGSERVAYLTQAGELVVHRCDDDAPVLRIVPEVLE